MEPRLPLVVIRRRSNRQPVTPTAALAILALAALAAGAPDATPATPPDGFVDLEVVTPSIRLDPRYATTNNFTGTVIDGYGARKVWLTHAAAEALAQVQEDLRPSGLSLLVFDGYRPQRAVDHFVRWSTQPPDPVARHRWHPRVPKDRLFDEGYIARRSGHSRGSTVDLTLAARTADGSWKPLDMGTPFDFFDPESATLSADVPPQARANRLLLKTVMENRGFRNYAAEWWHFRLVDEPFPETWFDEPIR